MKHTRWIVSILTFVLVLSLLPAAGFAAEPELPEKFGATELSIHVNPLYQNVLSPDDLGLSDRPVRPIDEAQKNAATYVTAQQAVQQMRSYMKARSESFVLYIRDSSSDYDALINDILLAAVVHTGGPKEGDYLMWQYGGMGGTVERTSANGQYQYIYTIEMAYYTTAAQEAQLDTAIANLLRSLNVSGKSDYQKVKAVYDYICSNVTYDNANLENDSYTLKFTAYAALINKTAVCQGYALLFYRLMLEMGIDCRVIAGEAGEPHGWNIVKLGNVYYNADTTWDAGMSEYQYFLKNSDGFLDHARYLEYMSTQFHTDYPMSATDYVDGVAGEPEYYFAIGACGDNVYWGVNRDHELTIAGEGATYDASRYGDLTQLSPWTYWTDGFEAVVIEEGVTTVGDALFFDMDNVKRVSLPDSLKEIGDFSFKQCGNLKELTLPEGLESIGIRAIYRTGLESLTIPDSVTYMNSDACALNPSLKEVTLGSGLTSGGYSAFSMCSNLSKVTMKDGLTFVGDYMFEDCPALTEIAFPSSLERIGMRAFSKTGIETLVIPDNIIEIDRSAFAECPDLTSVTIGNGLTSFGSGLFENCTALTSVTWGQSLTSTGGSTFSGCTSLTSVSIPDHITTIGWSAFHGCSSLARIDLGNGLETIEDSAFQGTALTEIDFPEGLLTIGDHAFRDCEGLTEVTIPSTVTYLSGFHGCDNLSQVNLENSSVETIGAYAFYACRNLDSFKIPSSVTAIKSAAFQYCSSLKEMFVPESVTDFASGFPGCTALETVYLNHQGRIPGHAFSGCTALKNVYISNNVTEIQVMAFTGCTALETIEIPESVRILGIQIFDDCVNLKEIYFYGEAPTFASDTFSTVRATAYYPGNLHSWTDDVLQNYGGNITWVSTHTHTTTSVVTPPDCVEKGYTTYTCSDCGRVWNADFVDALGHSYGEWGIAHAPTCVSAGEKQRECGVCGYIETGIVLSLGHSFADGFCTLCGIEKPTLDGVYRIAGSDRIATSMGIADQLKETLAIEKFNTMIVASALNFPDALTGSYLAAVKSAPILLTYEAAHSKVQAYIEANLSDGGTVYILGGESAVSAGFQSGLASKGIHVERLAGTDRFGTNLEIMKEAGVSADQPVLIATALNFADSLSASAAGLPMVLVYGSLRADQKAFLATTSKNFVIIGGSAAVSEELEAELNAIGTVDRLAGNGRHETSVMVAERFVQNPGAVVLAYARNFPDGLCGGPLSVALNAPLVLTDNHDPSAADTYLEGIASGIVVGGEGLISDDSAREIFDLEPEAIITAK